jgi:ribonuclease D
VSSAPTYDYIDRPEQLEQVIDALLDQPAYSLDTEFHREKTYFPKLALVQVAWGDRLVLIDPLAVDLRPFAAVLESSATAVIHASDQDLEVLQLTCGVLPAVLFDTQIAAGFLGLSTPSLSTLYEHFLRIRVGKGDRLTDWLQRPLTDAQLTYAATDVLHLPEIHTLLTTDLERRGRLQWALDECEIQRLRTRGQRDPDEAYRRIKEARQLKGRSLGVVRAVAAWRERRAAALDIPVRYVLSDIAVLGIAQRPPRSRNELEKIRGFDRGSREDVVAELLAEVAIALDSPTPGKSVVPAAPPLDRDLRPAVALVSAWVSQMARDLEIDANLLATRGDLEALLGGLPEARLAAGWRAELVGDPIRRLVGGQVAVAFAGDGELVIEERSHRPATTTAQQ